jgi:hypothetical protein
MASKALEKARVKGRKNRSSIDEIKMGEEPVFQKGETAKDVDKRLAMWSKAAAWYNYFYKPKDYIDPMLSFATEVCKYDKDKIKALKKLKDWELTGRLGKVAKLWQRGYEYTKPEMTRWKEELNEIYIKAQAAVEEEVAAPVEKVVISVQQRQRDKINETIAVDWDEIVDGWVDEKYTQSIDVFKLFKTYDLKGSSINMFKDMVMYEYQPIKDAYDNTCDQCVEAYSHITRRKQNKMLKVMEGIFSDLEQLKTANKATKVPRAKKPKASDVQVKNLKYRTDSFDDKVSSINPVMIPGKHILFVYNTKNKKLIQYATESLKGFEVSGTTIKNIGDGSRQTTLRKPGEILPLILKKSTKQIDKQVWDTVTTKISEPNGRISADCILLRVL